MKSVRVHIDNPPHVDPVPQGYVIKSESLRVSVTPEVHAALIARAREADASVAYIVRQAISLYLTTKKG